MLVREGRALPIITEDPFVKVLDKKDLNIGMLQWADQILCGKNNTRRTINADMRKALGHSGTYPNVGEKVICLRNYWDNINDSEDPLINGTIGMVTHIKKPL